MVIWRLKASQEVAVLETNMCSLDWWEARLVARKGHRSDHPFELKMMGMGLVAWTVDLDPDAQLAVALVSLDGRLRSE